MKDLLDDIESNSVAANGTLPATATSTSHPEGGPNGNAPLLANQKDPYYHVKREKPVHRRMLELAALGYNNSEIAKETGYTTVCVSNILRQAHSQQDLVNEIRRTVTVDDEVVEIIKKNVVTACKTYEKVMNDPSASREEKMKAADRFMDRRYGKAAQPFTQGSVVDLNSLSDEELSKLIPTAGTGTS